MIGHALSDLRAADLKPERSAGCDACGTELWFYRVRGPLWPHLFVLRPAPDLPRRRGGRMTRDVHNPPAYEPTPRRVRLGDEACRAFEEALVEGHRFNREDCLGAFEQGFEEGYSAGGLKVP